MVLQLIEIFEHNICENSQLKKIFVPHSSVAFPLEMIDIIVVILPLHTTMMDS